MHPGPPQDETTRLLRSAELISELIDEDLSYFATRVGRSEPGPGALVFAAGSRAERFYIVESGDLSISREGRVIARFGPGDVVGDFDFARGALRDAEARSEGGARLLVFPAEGTSLADLVEERPDASARLLLRSIGMISSRLRSVQRLISENDPWVRELRRQSWTDSATGLATKSFLGEEVPRLLEEPSLWLLMKPDRFKDLVDAHGHAAGDAAMVAIAKVLKDEVARLGRGWAIRIKSNETALVVPRCGREEAVGVARRIVQGYTAMDLGTVTGGAPFAFTVSQAMAFWPEHEHDSKRLFDSLYGVLMRAWRDGGARVYRMRGMSGGIPEGETDRRGATALRAGRL
jgi:diguanylate cyclase (GGDEF)-like protein